MAILGRPYPIFYLARNAESGLTNITAKIKKPDGTYFGPFALSEDSESGFEGTYFYNFHTNASTDLEGEYLIVLSEPDVNHKAISRVSFEKLESGSGPVDGISVIRTKGLNAMVKSKQYIECLAGSKADKVDAVVGNRSYDVQVFLDDLEAFVHSTQIIGDVK
jgi:hypothetical protein